MVPNIIEGLYCALIITWKEAHPPIDVKCVYILRGFWSIIIQGSPSERQTCPNDCPAGLWTCPCMGFPRLWGWLRGWAFFEFDSTGDSWWEPKHVKPWILAAISELCGFVFQMPSYIIMENTWPGNWLLEARSNVCKPPALGAPGGFRVSSFCTCRSAPAEAKETPKFAKDRVVKDCHAEFQECRDHVMGG